MYIVHVDIKLGLNDALSHQIMVKLRQINQQQKRDKKLWTKSIKDINQFQINQNYKSLL